MKFFLCLAILEMSFSKISLKVNDDTYVCTLKTSG